MGVFNRVFYFCLQIYQKVLIKTRKISNKYLIKSNKKKLTHLRILLVSYSWISIIRLWGSFHFAVFH